MNYFVLLLCFVFFSCEKKHKYAEIRKTLEKVMVDDQKFRQPIYDYVKQNPLDEKNIRIVTKIIDSLGWLGKDKIGKDANTALFATIQHSNKLSTMEKYLPIIKEASENGHAEKSQLAYLIDRVELLNNRKQIYGTQLSIRDNGKVFIENLINPTQVNARRKAMGLDTIEDYIRVCDSLNSANQ
jgi:hypothetical protein